MPQKNRPDAITRAQMPASSRSNPAIPIIIGILAILLFFFILLIFIGVIPLEVLKGDTIEDQRFDAVVNQTEQRAMSNLNATGSIYPNESDIPASPDHILSTLEKPFIAEEEQEERS